VAKIVCALCDKRALHTHTHTYTRARARARTL